MVPKGWEYKKLEDISSKDKYSMVDGPFGSNLKSEHYRDHGIPVLQSGFVTSGYFKVKKYFFVEKDLFEQQKRSAAKAGDILMAKIGAQAGRCGIIPNGHQESIIAGNCLKLSFDENLVSTKFIHLSLSWDYNKTGLADIKTVTAQPAISLKNLKSYKILVPPLPEQQKIATILSTWDKAISTTERLIENSTQQKKALMQQLLTGKKRLLDDKEKRFAGDWEDLSLNDMSELMTDYVANGSFQSLRENVSVSDGRDYSLYVRLTDLRLGLGHENQKYTDKQSYDFLKKSSLFGGELLMANIGANVGEVWQMPQVDMPATLAPNMLMTKFKKRAYSKFVYYFLSSSFGQNRISRAIAGSGHPKINKTDLKKVKVLLPPLEEQQKIATVLTNADKGIELLEQQLADLQQEKKALMQVLLTGKKRVVVDGED